MTSRPALTLALLAVLAGCASARGAGASAACASAAAPDPARLVAAFDSLHALALRGRAPIDLVLAPHDRKPQLDNPGEVQQLFMKLYPPALRDAGVGGTTALALLVDATGNVGEVRLVRGSGHDELDRASMTVVRSMRWRPARQGSCPVPFYMGMPITWSLEYSR